MENSTPKFDVFSMALTILELENTSYDFCGKFSTLIENIEYDSFSMKNEIVKAFENVIMLPL